MQVKSVQRSPRLMAEKLRRSRVFLSGIKGSKRAHISISQISSLSTTSRVLFILNSIHKASQPYLSQGNTEAVT
jgi:hypothetical protein